MPNAQAKADPTDEPMVDDPLDASNAQNAGSSELSAYEAEIAAMMDAEPLDDEEEQSPAPSRKEPTEESDDEDEADDEESDEAESADAGDGTNEDAPEEDADEEEAPKSDRFRIRAKDDVEAEALALRKRHPDLSLKDCLAKAELILGVKVESGAAQEQARESETESVASITQQIETLRAQRKAATLEMEFELQADLDAQIDELRDKRDEVRVTEGRASAQNEIAQQQAFEDEYRKHERTAVAYYPDAKDANSPLVKRMVEMDAEMLQNNDPLYHSPKKALILARDAALELGIRQANPNAAAAKSSRSKTPMQPAPGNRGTTAAAPAKKVADAIGNLNSLEAYNAFVGID